MKQALLVAAVEPTIGGVLAFGDRGTGKSTAMQALAALPPPMDVVPGCRYACDPAAPATRCDECREQGRHGRVAAPVPVVDMPLRSCQRLEHRIALIACPVSAQGRIASGHPTIQASSAVLGRSRIADVEMLTRWSAMSGTPSRTTTSRIRSRWPRCRRQSA